jgi:predicted lipoprotein
MSLKQWGIGWLCCSALLLTACRVVDLDENGQPIIPPDPNAKASFANQTPAQIAQQTWNSKVMTPAQSHALDSSTLKTRAASANNESVFVKVQGKVDSVSLDNERERTLTVTVNDQPLQVQVGPMIRGNAIRDATGYKFEDFTNQVQFAQLSKAYNREAAKHLPKVDESWQQQPVTVVMAVTMRNGALSDAAAISLERGQP